MTDDSEWDPHSEDFVKQEEVVANLEEIPAVPRERRIYAFRRSSPTSVTMSQISSTLDEELLIENLEATVKVSSAKSTKRQSGIGPEELAKRWGIGLETATRILKVTTQRGIRNVSEPLHRRFRTRTQQMRYRHLNSRFYSDTMFASTRSIRGNKVRNYL
jgi:hypothetical protein